jgi:PST family polysaccharide transporter
VSEGLRDRALRGGAALLVRQVLSIILGAAGLVALTRLIGPADYGYYAGGLAVILVLIEVASFGVKVFLVRRPGDLERAVVAQAFAALAVGAAGAVSLTAGLVVLLGDRLIDANERPALLLMLAAIPFALAAIPPFAVLERDLRYRTVATIEFFNDVLFYAVALPLAAAGVGLWAPAVGYLTTQVLFFLRAARASRTWPSFSWSWPLLRELLAFGATFSAGQWAFQARRLVNPVIVGSLAGPTAVGVVALAIRAAETLSFVGMVTWRLSIATFARIRDDVEQLRAGVREAAALQILATGPLLVAFAALSPWFIPLAFGDEWTALVDLFPLVAIASLTSVTFNMVVSALYVRERNVEVIWFQLLRLGLFAGAAVVAVAELGVVGYGVAEAVALSGFVLLLWRARDLLGAAPLRSLPLLVAFSLAMLAVLLPRPAGYALLLAPAVVLLRSTQRRYLREYLGHVRDSLLPSRFGRLDTVGKE